VRAEARTGQDVALFGDSSKHGFFFSLGAICGCCAGIRKRRKLTHVNDNVDGRRRQKP
jgi:hypothetical protein